MGPISPFLFYRFLFFFCFIWKHRHLRLWFDVFDVKRQGLNFVRVWLGFLLLENEFWRSEVRVTWVFCSMSFCCFWFGLLVFPVLVLFSFSYFLFIDSVRNLRFFGVFGDKWFFVFPFAYAFCLLRKCWKMKEIGVWILDFSLYGI